MSAIATTFEATRVKELTGHTKILIGGLGALTPIVLNLVIVDLNTTLANLTALVFLGYLLRVVVLFYLGGLVAYFQEEKSRLKLFELGIVAPALLTGIMNGTTNIQPTLRASNNPPAASVSVMDAFDAFMPTAYAQTKQAEVKKYSLPKESVTAQLWRGISGRQNERVWFVVAGTYDTNQLEKARALVRRIQQSTPGYSPEIYKNDKYYAVVIGANLTLEQARERKQQASAAKLPAEGDIYLFNPWDSK
jgi:hypothetical protein